MGTINIVLYEPEIPANTGNIIRTCAATGAVLHLIEPLGFRLDSRHVKRSGVNYLAEAQIKRYIDWEDFCRENAGEFFFFSRYGEQNLGSLIAGDTSKDYYLVFGKESTGISKDILKMHLERVYRIPMREAVRALNLSNSVAIALYEVLRQQDYRDLSRTEPECLKGPHFLANYEEQA